VRLPLYPQAVARAARRINTAPPRRVVFSIAPDHNPAPLTSFPRKADMADDPDNTLYLDLESGRVIIRLRPDLAPKHVKRLKELVREGFYDGLTFHRVIDGFMAQTGCPQGTGMGGSGTKIPAEFTPQPFVRGTVGAARSQSPNSADSQFFIMFDDGDFLNGQYTVWGEVIEGMEHVDKIPKGEPPRKPGTIKKMQIASDGLKTNLSA
jgi:peptidylprolyl isomerase